ncbi:MAG: glycosyltransferase [Actinomycetota bacterium]|nr:glycosyltransferase [Actinomycetota bacterium]
MKSEPQVLRLITRLNIGGPALQALLLTRELAQRFPTMLGAGMPGKGEGELSDPRVSVHRLPLVRHIDPVRDVIAIARVRGLIGRSEARLVHTHMAKAGFVGRVAVKGMTRRVRTVHTFHGHVLEGYFSAPAQRLFIGVERWLARRTDVLIAVSNRVRDDLIALGIGAPEQWRVIPLGFDLAPFLEVAGPRGTFRAELQIPNGAPLIGALGRFAPVKDHMLLLEGVALLPDVHLALMGDGELKPKLFARASAADLQGRVHFVGWRRDVPDVLSDLDVVALTSLNEGTPVSLIEALAAGRPVVATDVGGVRDVVQPGDTGLLVSSRDPADVAHAIQALLDDPDGCGRLAQEGRRRVAARFTADRLVRDIGELYEELLE